MNTNNRYHKEIGTEMPQRKPRRRKKKESKTVVVKLDTVNRVQLYWFSGFFIFVDSLQLKN